MLEIIYRPKLVLTLFFMFVTTAALPQISLAETGQRTTDYYIHHNSIEPFYQNHNLDPAVILHVREVVSAGRERTAGRDQKVLLLVHGATFPAAIAFDLNYPNASMMQSLASLGWDTFALDIEGYGESTRPPSMDFPGLYPDDNAPISPLVSLADVNRVVDFIRDLRGIDTVHLLGWSAGAYNEVPAFAIAYPEKTGKVILMGSIWPGSPKTEEENKETMAKADSRKVDIGFPFKAGRWNRFGTKVEELPPGLLDVYIKDHTASDPKSGELGGGVRKPSGRMVLSTESTPRFDPGKITAPTLVLRGELDTIAKEAENQALLDALGSTDKQMVSIPNTGHFQQFESSNALTYTAIIDFLEK